MQELHGKAIYATCTYDLSEHQFINSEACSQRKSDSSTVENPSQKPFQENPQCHPKSHPESRPQKLSAKAVVHKSPLQKPPQKPSAKAVRKSRPQKLFQSSKGRPQKPPPNATRSKACLFGTAFGDRGSGTGVRGPGFGDRGSGTGVRGRRLLTAFGPKPSPRASSQGNLKDNLSTHSRGLLHHPRVCVPQNTREACQTRMRIGGRVETANVQ